MYVLAIDIESEMLTTGGASNKNCIFEITKGDKQPPIKPKNTIKITLPSHFKIFFTIGMVLSLIIIKLCSISEIDLIIKIDFKVSYKNLIMGL